MNMSVEGIWGHSLCCFPCWQKCQKMGWSSWIGFRLDLEIMGQLFWVVGWIWLAGVCGMGILYGYIIRVWKFEVMLFRRLVLG